MKLQFTIRDLLWLAVVVALIVGWYLDRNAVQERAKAHEAQEIAGANADYNLLRGQFITVRTQAMKARLTASTGEPNNSPIPEIPPPK